MIWLYLCAAPAIAGELDDGYPESRFGQPPMQADLGIRQGYASRAVVNMEANEEDLGGTSRRPAGLEMTPPSRSQTPPAPELNPAGAPVAPSSLGSSASRKGVQEIAVIAGDLGYFPKTVFVARDVPVRMYVTGASKNTLCIMMDSFQVRKQVRSQKIEEITFTPTTPGRYRFYCPVNGMEGNLIVKEFAAATN